MGFDKYSTIYTFIIGAFTSISLIKSNNNSEINQITGKIFLVLFSMKLFEYFIWIDKDCQFGLNITANLMGSILDNIIPSLIFIFFTKKNRKFDDTITYLNVGYLIYVIYTYISFVKNNKLCTKLENNGTIVYGWNDDFNFSIYLAMLAINVFYLYPDNSKYIIMISYFLVLLVNKIKKWNHHKSLSILITFLPYLIEKIQN